MELILRDGKGQQPIRVGDIITQGGESYSITCFDGNYRAVSLRGDTTLTVESYKTLEELIYVIQGSFYHYSLESYRLVLEEK